MGKHKRSKPNRNEKRVDKREQAARHSRLLGQRKANVREMVTAFIENRLEDYEALKKANEDLTADIERLRGIE